MIKKFFITSLIFTALSINNFHELHAAKGRRTIEQARALAQVEWTEADIIKKRDVAFAQKINALSKNPEALRNYLAQNQLKRYPDWVEDAQQQKHYQAVARAIGEAITKSSNSTVANDLAQAFATLVDNLDSSTVKKLKLDDTAAQLTNSAQPAGGGAVAPPVQPAAEERAKEDKINIIEEMLNKRIPFTSVFDNTRQQLCDFMSSLSNFLKANFDQAAQARIKFQTKDLQNNFTLLKNLNKQWLSFNKDFSNKKAIASINDADNLINLLTRIKDSITNSPLKDLLQADQNDAYQSSGLFNSKLHAMWTTTRPSVFTKRKRKTNEEKIKELLDTVSFDTIKIKLDMAIKTKQNIDRMIDVAQKANNLETQKTLNTLSYSELEGLEEQYNKLKTVSSNGSINTLAVAAQFKEAANNLLKTIESWAIETNEKPVKLREALEPVAAINQKQDEIRKQLNNKDLNDNAFGETIHDFMDALNPVANEFSQEAINQLSEANKKNYKVYQDLSKQWADFSNLRNRISSVDEAEKILTTLQSIKDEIKDASMKQYFKIDDASAKTPQDKNNILKAIWDEIEVPREINSIKRILQSAINLENALGEKNLSIQDFMRKLEEFLAATTDQTALSEELKKDREALQLFHKEWQDEFMTPLSSKVTTRIAATQLHEKLKDLVQQIKDQTKSVGLLLAKDQEQDPKSKISNKTLNTIWNHTQKDYVDSWKAQQKILNQKVKAKKILDLIDFNNINQMIETATNKKQDINAVLQQSNSINPTRTKIFEPRYDATKPEEFKLQYLTLLNEQASIGTSKKATDFKKRVDQLSENVTQWLANQAQIKTNLESIISETQAINNIRDNLSAETVGYDNVFGDSTMLIPDFMQALGKFVHNLSQEDQDSLPNQAQDNFKILQDLFDNVWSQQYLNQVKELKENTSMSSKDRKDGINKLQETANYIKQIIKDEKTKALLEKNTEGVEPHERNNQLQYIWEIKPEVQAIAIQKNLMSTKINYESAFGKKDSTVAHFIDSLQKFLNKFKETILPEEQKQHFDKLQTFYKQDFKLNFKEKVKTTQSQQAVKELRINAENIKKNINNEDSPLKYLFIADNDSAIEPQNRNALLKQLWTANEIAKIEKSTGITISFDIDKITSLLNHITKINNAITNLQPQAIAANKIEAAAALKDYKNTETEDLFNEFLRLQSELDGDTINTQDLATAFQNRITTLEKNIVQRSEYLVKLQENLNTIVTVSQKITEINGLLKTTIDYPNAFGKATMTIESFMDELRVFVNEEFSDQEIRKLSGSIKTDFTTLQRFYNEIWLKNFYERFTNLHNPNVSTLQKLQNIEGLSATFESIKQKINEDPMKSFFIEDNPNKRTAQERNNKLKAIWEAMKKR